jgi:Flp pilus assembly pilin Flp
MIRIIQRLLKNKRGAPLIEYGLIAGLLAIAIFESLAS